MFRPSMDGVGKEKIGRMSKSFTAEPRKIGELFASPFFFRVPSYQRPFSWDADHFRDLIDDLSSADKSSEYFLGTVVLHKTDDVGNHDIVDGQQRLTSISILLACLRDAIENVGIADDLQDKILQKAKELDGIPEKVRLEVRYRDLFDAFVAEKGGTLVDHQFPHPNDVTRRYEKAVNEFRDRLAKLTQVEIAELAKFVSQKCVLIVLIAPTFEEAFRLFSIVNDRGKQLRRIDLLKAYNLAPERVPSETVRETLAGKWEEFENDLGGARFEDVFFTMRLIYLKDKPQRDLFSEFKDRIFSKGLDVAGEKFIHKALKYAALYKAVFKNKDYLPKDHDDYERFVSLIHIMDTEFKASEWRTCVIQFAEKFGRDSILKFIEKLQFLFLEHWISGMRKDERFSDYATILAAIDKKGSTPESAMEAVDFDTSVIVSGLRNSKLYDAGYARYVLLRMELLASEMDQVRPLNAKSVEHVLPQTVRPGSDWEKWNDPAVVDEYVHTLGNLILLSGSKNSSAGNKDFEEKKKKYLKPKSVDLPRTADVLVAATWSRADIEARTEEAVATFFDPI